MTGNRLKAIPQRVGNLSADAELDFSQFKAILDSLVEGVIIFDAQGGILQMNSAAMRLHDMKSSHEIRWCLPEFMDICELYDMSGDLLPRNVGLFDAWWTVKRSWSGKGVSATSEPRMIGFFFTAACR